VHIEIAGGPVDDVAVLKIVEECFEDWAGVRDRLVAGQYELY
jgi:hypothetical protein